MKAKEYAKRYLANRTIGELSDIVAAFIQEAVELQETRKAYSEAAQYAILNEQDQKWRAFARLVEGVNPDGFQGVVKETAPEHYEGWQHYRARATGIKSAPGRG